MNETVGSVAGATVSAVPIAWGYYLSSHSDHKLRNTGFLWMAWGYGIQAVTFCIFLGAMPASFPAISAALCLWWWWNNGGGDGLKSWAQSFGGASPQTA